MSIVDKYSTELRENKCIKYEGLCLWPLKVKQYALYRAAKDSFELMQASLSPKLARLSWFPCLDALDRDIEQMTGEQSYYCKTAVFVMIAAMHLPENMGIKIARDAKGNINAVAIEPSPGITPVLLNMKQMRDIREIIAAQNGYEIPDEGWTLELYRAQKQLEQLSDGAGLKFDLEDLVYSVAVNTGRDPDEIWEWSIRRFLMMQKAVDRKLGYVLSRLTEDVGNKKYTKGNPYPDWRFRREGDRPKAFKSLNEIEGKAKGIINSPDLK